MQRQLKKWLVPILPRSIVEYVKRRASAGFNSGPIKELVWQKAEDHLACVIDGSYTFLTPRNLGFGYDLDLHRSSPEGRAEISGMVDAAIEGGIMFDIGAHVGIMSAIFCAVRPTNRVYSFEPSPVSQKKLEAIRALNRLEDRMFIQPTAIGKEKAKLEMQVDPVGGYVQIQNYDHAGWSQSQKLEVTVESIPEAAQRLGVIPNFIKLDIEGYEYEAVQGAQNFLKEHRPILLFELHSNYLEQRGLSPGQVVSLLTECGYVFSTYTGQLLTAKFISNSPLGSCRFLATPKKT